MSRSSAEFRWSVPLPLRSARIISHLVPWMVLGATAALLAAKWESLPERFAVHFNGHGVPDAWSQRTLLGIFGPLLVGALSVCGVATLRWLLGSHGGNARATSSTQIALSVAEIFVAIVFANVATIPLWGSVPLVISAIAGPIVIVVVSLRLASREPPRPARDSDPYWHKYPFYDNPAEPAWVVPKRGNQLGVTFNIAHRGARIFLFVLFLFPFASVLFTFFYLRHG